MLIFYGSHSSDWMNVLNSGLSKDLSIQILNCCDANILQNINHKYIIPLMESHTKELLRKNIPTYVGISLETLTILSNKKLFYEKMLEYDLTNYVPRTWTKPFTNSINKKLIVKPYDMCAGYGQYIVNNSSKLNDKVFDKHIVQEYTYGNKEYAAQIVFMNEILECVLYECTYAKTEYIRGPSYLNDHERCKVNNDDFKEHLQVIAKVLARFNYLGICCVDFKISENG